MEIKLIKDYGVELAETPIWDPRIKKLYWTDLFTGDVHRFDPQTGNDEVFKTGKLIGSAIPCDDVDKLLVAVEGGLYILDTVTESMQFIVDPDNGNDQNRYNDTRVDANGRIFASSVSKLYGTDYYTPDMLGNFYMVDVDGSVKTIETGINQYNGIVWNSGNTKMFVVDTYNQLLIEYNYDINYGPVSEKRTAIDFKEQGMPDGMSIDEDDNLYICHWTGIISVWDKNMNLKETIEFPVEYVCCGGFGGEDMKDFYVASSKYCYTEEDLKRNVGAGGLFAARSQVRGTLDNYYKLNNNFNKGEDSMQPFEFSVPTKIVFGAGEVQKVGQEALAFGKKALMVTYDEDFVKQVGFYDKVKKSCDEAGVELLEFYGVKSNPTAEHAAIGIKMAKEQRPDVIIALGGGSVMDSAKYIGIAAMYDGDPWDFVLGKAEIKETLPVITVVTIPATSSELNGTSVINNETLRRKDGFANPVMKPKVSILDPELTYSIPFKQTAYSAADIVSHLLEHYLGHQLKFTPYQDHFCQGGIRSIMECMDRLLENPRDPDARAIMMWQAAFAWSGFYDCGFGLPNSIIHILGHSLSNFYDTPHGAAMSVTILGSMRYYLKERTKKYADFAREVFGVRDNDDMIAACAGIAALEAWFKKIGTPTTLAEAGITDPDAIDKMAPDALKTAEAWGEIEEYNYNEQVMRDMFELCK